MAGAFDAYGKCHLAGLQRKHSSVEGVARIWMGLLHRRRNPWIRGWRGYVKDTPVLIIVEAQFMQIIQENNVLASEASNHQCPIHVASTIGDFSRPAFPTPQSGQSTCSLRNLHIKTKHNLDTPLPYRLSCHRCWLRAFPSPCGQEV